MGTENFPIKVVKTIGMEISPRFRKPKLPVKRTITAPQYTMWGAGMATSITSAQRRMVKAKIDGATLPYHAYIKNLLLVGILKTS